MENFALLSRDLATQSVEWHSRPAELEFSFNNACNLDCIMCGRSDQVPRLVLDEEKGIDALETILPNTLQWTPSSYSEPFLNDFETISRLCEKHQVSLFIFTNGYLCTRERFLEIRKHVHKIWFSFDSHIPETYERIRKGSCFDKVVENMANTVESAKEDGTECCFQIVLMRLNVMELADYVRFVASLGGRKISVQELIPASRHFHDLKVDGAFSDDEVLEALDRARAAARDCAVDLFLKLRPPFVGDALHAVDSGKVKNPLASLREIGMASIRKLYPFFCNMAAGYLKITPDGWVFPCCRAPSSLRMGNIQDQPFEEIWNNERYRSFRKGMFEGRYDPACRDCYIFKGHAQTGPAEEGS